MKDERKDEKIMKYETPSGVLNILFYLVTETLHSLENMELKIILYYYCLFLLTQSVSQPFRNNAYPFVVIVVIKVVQKVY